MGELEHIEVHGHRGARSKFPENTMESFRYALDVGVDAIEIDIALTQDKVPVILHDRTLNAKLYRWSQSEASLPDFTQTAQLIRDLSAAQISKLDVGSRPNDEFPEQTLLVGATPPTLDEFVQLMMSHPQQAKLNIEIKTHPFLPDATESPEDFIAACLAVLAAHKVPYERVLFQSFDPRSLVALKEADPKWRASYLTDTWNEDLPEVTRELGIEALSPRWDLLTAERAKSLRDAGLDIYAWTPNTPEQWERLAQIGVNGIITDDPAACLAFRDAASL